MIILNFHGVGPVTRDVDAGERDCWLETAAFEAVLDLVVGKSHVRLTVDDGNASDHEYILPALQKRGLRADFFLCSARTDQPTFLTRGQIRALIDAGMGIGSHGVDHRPWRSLSGNALAAEISGSRRALEEVCGKSVDTAACPFGSYGRASLAELKRAGYRAVYTSDGGSARDGAWLCPRNTVTRSTRLDDIHRLIAEGPSVLRQISVRAKSALKRIRP